MGREPFLARSDGAFHEGISDDVHQDGEAVFEAAHVVAGNTQRELRDLSEPASPGFGQPDRAATRAVMDVPGRKRDWTSPLTVRR